MFSCLSGVWNEVVMFGGSGERLDRELYTALVTEAA